MKGGKRWKLRPGLILHGREVADPAERDGQGDVVAAFVWR